MNFLLKKRVLVILFLLFCIPLQAQQFLMDMIDTTKEIGRGMFSMYKKFDHIRIGGYIQPQFQMAQEKGARSYVGGDFPAFSNSRFMLRRGRIRFDYARFNQSGHPSLQFVFQFDGTERGVFIRDFWGRVFENKWHLFSFTTGMMGRPFGFEMNYSSQFRESPERGRMSQILMRTERDLGAMVSFEPRGRKNFLQYLKIEAGLYNGQGLTGNSEFDSFKDFISQAGIKSVPFSKNITLSAGVSYYKGGMIQNSKYIYHTTSSVNGKEIVVDSSISNIGKKAPRQYNGINAQLKLKNGWGITELRGEYWKGTQTALAGTTETPGSLPNEPHYIRKFDGAFFYILQNIINKKHQMGIKYDWYDPNTEVKKNEIGKPGANINATNIKYSTLSVGYNYYINENLKMFLWYDFVKNETTLLQDYTKDKKDNTITCRLQFSF
jgi:hypothetical protein